MGMAILTLPQEKTGAFWRALRPTWTAPEDGGTSQWLDTVPSPMWLCCTTACTKQGLGPFLSPTGALKESQWSPSPIPLQSLWLPAQLCPLTFHEPSSTSSSTSSSLPRQPAQGTVTDHSGSPLAPGLVEAPGQALLAPGTAWNWPVPEWVRARGRLQLKPGQHPRPCDMSVGGQCVCLSPGDGHKHLIPPCLARHALALRCF